MNARRAALRINSGKNIFIGSSETPAGVSELLFHGDIPLYDRIMNLYKHFCKGLDSRAKTIIMVLALRNKEC